jgi:hypothetical protein
VRTPQAPSNPGRSSSPAVPADGSEPHSAEAPIDRPSVGGGPAARPTGPHDQPADGQAAARPPADGDTTPGEETMLLKRPTTPAADQGPDQATEIGTKRASTSPR